MVVGKEGLRARVEVVPSDEGEAVPSDEGEAVPSDEGVAVPRGEVLDHHGRLGGQASRIREVDREIRETRSCRRWRMGGWRWSRRGRQ